MSDFKIMMLAAAPFWIIYLIYALGVGVINGYIKFPFKRKRK